VTKDYEFSGQIKIEFSLMVNATALTIATFIRCYCFHSVRSESTVVLAIAAFTDGTTMVSTVSVKASTVTAGKTTELI